MKHMKTIHINPQSKGSLGKSFETECRTAWLDAIGIPWYGYDLDERHKTFQKRHSKNVQFIDVANKSEDESREQVSAMIQDALNRPEPVVFIDCKAQSDDLMMTSFDSLSLFEYAREADAEFVLSLFPSDDNTSMSNLGDIVQWGYQGGARFVIVYNPTKSKGILFDNSPMQQSLLSVGAKEIHVPALMPTTIRELEKRETEKGRGITFGEFASGIKGVPKTLLTSDMICLLRKMSKQYASIADVLLPASELCNVPEPKVEATEFRKTLNVSL